MSRIIATCLSRLKFLSESHSRMLCFAILGLFFGIVSVMVAVDHFVHTAGWPDEDVIGVAKVSLCFLISFSGFTQALRYKQWKEPF